MPKRVCEPDISFSFVLPVVSHKARDRICSFMNFPKGWRYGEGVKFQEHVKDMAFGVIQIFETYGIKIGAFPCMDGSFLVSGYSSNQTVDVFCRPDSKIDIELEENDILQQEKTGLELSDLEDFLRELLWEPKLFVCFMSQNSVKTGSDLRVQLSENPLMVESHLSMKIVLTAQAGNYVHTLGSTTKKLPDIHRLSGESMPTHSQTSINSQMRNLQLETTATGTSAL